MEVLLGFLLHLAAEEAAESVDEGEEDKEVTQFEVDLTDVDAEAKKDEVGTAFSATAAAAKVCCSCCC